MAAGAFLFIATYIELNVVVTNREDIQAESLLKLDQPLQKVYERLDSKETGYMDSVWDNQGIRIN